MRICYLSSSHITNAIRGEALIHARNAAVSGSESNMLLIKHTRVFTKPDKLLTNVIK